MSALVPRATQIAHLFLALAAGPGDTVIDATAGAGRDACFLAALVGKSGQVWAFDIQEQAIELSRAELTAQGLLRQTRLILDDHAHLASYNIPPAAAAVFNLGWLPGGDHNLKSSAKSTVQALEAALDKLKPGGALVVTAYPKHEGGAKEAQAVLEWAAGLPATRAETLHITFPAKEQAPTVMLIERIW